MADAITKGVHIKVISEYVHQESIPHSNHYLFTYTVSISNHSQTSVQLISRHWIITNADGKREDVKGLGVIGQQPTIRPGESYSYSSFCPLDTPVGSMQGSYQMITSNGDQFDAVIPPFTLAVPDILN